LLQAVPARDIVLLATTHSDHELRAHCIRLCCCVPHTSPIIPLNLRQSTPRSDRQRANPAHRTQRPSRMHRGRSAQSGRSDSPFPGFSSREVVRTGQVHGDWSTTPANPPKSARLTQRMYLPLRVVLSALRCHEGRVRRSIGQGVPCLSQAVHRLEHRGQNVPHGISSV
jgi:hypothetical protein